MATKCNDGKTQIGVPRINSLNPLASRKRAAFRQKLRHRYLVGLLVLVASGSAWAQTDSTKEATSEATTTEATKDTKPPCPRSEPSFPQMAYDEDNRYLSDPACRKEALDRLKYIPLGKDKNYYLSFGAMVRERGEYYNHPNLGGGSPGSTYLLQRYYVHADLHLSERVRVFGQLLSNFEHGRKGGPRPLIDEDKVDIHQLFGDVVVWRSGKNHLALRVGRQEMVFGDQSLVSNRDSRNVRRSVDGVRAMGQFGEWKADAFAVRESNKKLGFFDDSFNHTNSFWGLYVVRPFRTLPGGHVDLFYMGLDNKVETFVKGKDREQRETAGARLWGSTEHLDYNQKYMFQWGRFGSGDIRSWAVATETGYRLDSILFKPRFAIKADAYRGDHDRSGRTLGTLGTFNSLFESSSYFSYASLFGRRNLINLQPSVELKLPRKITLTPNAAVYWRQSREDGLYSSSGSVVVAGLKSDARFIGSHVAAQVKWSVDRHITVFGEYLHFFPGDFVKQSTAGRNTNYATWWVDYRF